MPISFGWVGLEVAEVIMRLDSLKLIFDAADIPWTPTNFEKRVPLVLLVQR